MMMEKKLLPREIWKSKVSIANLGGNCCQLYSGPERLNAVFPNLATAPAWAQCKEINIYCLLNKVFVEPNTEVLFLSLN